MIPYEDLIHQLKRWGKRTTGEQRAIIADLRRGANDLPRIAPHLHQHIAPFAIDRTGWDKRSVYLIATLFALYHAGSNVPDDNDKVQSLGSSFGKLLTDKDNGAIERRFNVLLVAHPDDLHYQLRQAIAYLRGAEKPVQINWLQLLWDVRQWQDDDKRPDVQEKWASQFWQAKYEAENKKQENK